MISKKRRITRTFGTTYFKGGFYKIKRNILKILKFSPPEKKNLKYLLLVNEKLKILKTKNHCLCLEELDKDMNVDKIYFLIL